MNFRRGVSRISGLLAAVCLSVAGFAVATINAGAQGDDQITVSVAGLRIVSAPYNGEDQMRPFNWSDGTALALQVVHEGGGLIMLDRDASKLVTLRTDTGEDLMEGRSSWPSGVQSANISEDSKAAMVEMSGPSAPGKDAREIHATGEIVFLRATEQETTRLENIPLEADQKIDADPFLFTITKSGKPAWGDEPLEISLEARHDLHALAEIRFYDVDGEHIPSRRTGSSRMAFGNNITVTHNYVLDKEAEVADIEIIKWKDMGSITIPFDLKTGVGVGGE